MCDLSPYHLNGDDMIITVEEKTWFICQQSIYKYIYFFLWIDLISAKTLKITYMNIGLVNFVTQYSEEKISENKVFSFLVIEHFYSFA